MSKSVLKLALTLSLAFSARTLAKPPDLPQPTKVDCKTETATVDFVPLLEPLSVQVYTEGEEAEAGSKFKGACSCPLECFAEWLSVWVTSGPFGAYAALESPCEAAKSQKPCTEELPVKPRDVSVCPYVKDQQAKKAKPKKLSKAYVKRRLEECEQAGRLFEQFGFYKDARDCYLEIQRLAPKSDEARAAAAKLKGLPRPESEGEEAETPQAAQPAGTKHVLTAYDISDLVGEKIVNNKARVTQSERKLAAQLQKYIAVAIEPKTWQSAGGAGTLEYNPKTNSLVVSNTTEVQQRIAALLEKLGLLQKLDGSVQEWLDDMTQQGATEPSVAKPQPAPKLALMGLDIRDLLTTHEVAWDRATDSLRVVTKDDHASQAAELIRLIENGVAPDSWASKGGPGRIEYNSELKTIFVTNRGEVLEDVAALLQSRRRELKVHKECCEYQVRAAEAKKRYQQARQQDAQVKVVEFLLQESHEALVRGQRQKATTLASTALLLNRKATLEHPLVYKMQLLAQLFPEPGQVPLKVRMPAVAGDVVHAYTEILDLFPGTVAVKVIQPKPVVKPAVLHVDESECELEVVPECKKDCAGSCCCDLDLNGGRVRVQMQLGPWTFKVLDEGQGKSFTLSLKCCGKE